MSARQETFPALLQRLQPECDRIVAQFEHQRSALLMLAHLFQQEEGYVSREATCAIAGMTGVTPAEAESTISFYTLLFQRPVGKYVLQPCRGLACAINGAEATNAYFRERLGLESLQTSDDGTFSYEEVECLAACDRAPCMQVNLEFVYDLTPEKIDALLAELRGGTSATPALAQTDTPAKTWRIRQDRQIATGEKADGAIDVPRPNNAGGLGDHSGTIMLDHIVARDVYFFERTRERAVADSRAIAEMEPETERAGH